MKKYLIVLLLLVSCKKQEKINVKEVDFGLINKKKNKVREELWNYTQQSSGLYYSLRH